MIWFLLWGGMGCDSPEPAPPCPDPMTVEVGTGMATYEVLDEGEPLEMVHGPQGGWHMMASLKVCNSTEIINFNYTITDQVSGERVSDNYLTVRPIPVDTCCSVFYGVYGYLNVSALEEGTLDSPPELLACHDLRLEMVVEDETGQVASDAVMVEAACDPIDSGVCTCT